MQIAAEVAAPLAKTDEIVMLSGSSNFTNEINKFVSQVPPAIHALTGVDLSEVTFTFSFFFAYLMGANGFQNQF